MLPFKVFLKKSQNQHWQHSASSTSERAGSWLEGSAKEIKLLNLTSQTDSPGQDAMDRDENVKTESQHK